MSREGERERVFKRNHGNNKGASISCPLTHTPDSRRETALSRTEIIRHFNHPQTSYVFIPKILPLLTLIFSSFPPSGMCQEEILRCKGTGAIFSINDPAAPSLAPVTEGHSARADWGLPKLGAQGAIADDSPSWRGLDALCGETERVGCLFNHGVTLPSRGLQVCTYFGMGLIGWLLSCKM